MIKVILADDAEVMRKAISNLLRDSSVDLVAETNRFSGLMKLVAEHRPDVVILDLHMPDEDTFRVAELKSCLDGCPLVAISLWDDKETKALADAFGARLLLDKSRLNDQLIPAIEQCTRQ
jgi:DNA-binding NarL/FixJ family response regulator